MISVLQCDNNFVVGHVDHGKTTLLDYFRKSNIAAGEAGGITQHIGAFSVDLKNGARVTFLDTPGHEAFCDMRHRGALITDLVILVVAAPDSVQNQTIESIKFALEAKVPVIVAITKSDLATTGMKDIESELSYHGIVSESYGGETQAIKVSALTVSNSFHISIYLNICFRDFT